MEACQEECLDCFSYMEGRGDGAEKDADHLRFEITMQLIVVDSGPTVCNTLTSLFAI